MRKILIAIAATLCLSHAALAEETSPKDAPSSKDAPAVKTVQPKSKINSETKSEPTTPPGYHEAHWKGGHGATWKTGYHSYGFEGYFAGCHYTGHAGPHGYHLDKVC